MTRFDHRLHPLSVPFGLLTQLRQFALPALAFLVTAGSTGFGWEVWLLVPLTLSSALALAKYLTFRYRYEPDHIVIRQGLVFRNERHIPYARIQNIDAVQTVLHRLAGVAEVRIDTGGGREPEARLDVLPLAAMAEMRERVFGASPAATIAEPSRVERPLLALDLKDLVIVGFIHNRGMIVVGAIFGLLWETGVMDWLIDSVAGTNVSGRGLIRALVRSVVGAGRVSLEQLLLAGLALAGFLVLVRGFSVGWAIVRLYGFTLTRVGNDLRISCGLLTHISATVPLRRIQTVSIRETVLHRLFDRVSVRVETAGGQEAGGDDPPPHRDWLAPIIPRAELPVLLQHLLPGVHLDRLDWHPPAPRAFRREMFGWLMMATIAALAAARLAGPWALLLWLVIVGWGAFVARKYVAHLHWAAGDGVVVLKSGWLSRQTNAAPFVKIQVVGMHESPLDRRHRMASVTVDTAGARDVWQSLSIPYLARDTAAQLRLRLATEAQHTAFEW